MRFFLWRKQKLRGKNDLALFQNIFEFGGSLFDPKKTLHLTPSIQPNPPQDEYSVENQIMVNIFNALYSIQDVL